MSLTLVWALVCAVAVPFFVLQASRRKSALRLTAAAAHLSRAASQRGLGPEQRERCDAALRLMAKAIAPSKPEEEAVTELGRTRNVSHMAFAVGAYCTCYLLVAPFADLAIVSTVWLQGYASELAALLQFGFAWPLLIAAAIWSHEARIHLDDAAYWLDQADKVLVSQTDSQAADEPRRPLF